MIRQNNLHEMILKSEFEIVPINSHSMGTGQDLIIWHTQAHKNTQRRKLVMETHKEQIHI